VVVSHIAPFTEYLQSGDCTWANPMEVTSIAQALQDALQHRDEAAIARSAQRLGAQFSWARSAARHVQIYQETLIPCL
jgi:glycosyltransferase involved in cell wall biosynthesis